MIETVKPPKALADNKIYRALVLHWADTPERQERVKQRCRGDIIFFIDTFGFQYNPDNRGHEVEPFICYEFQEKVLRRTLRRLLELRMPVVWEKSRKLGATWMMDFLQVHQCTFHDRQKFMDISHNEDAVNKPDDPDTLFWKLQFILDYLPAWMTKVRRLNKSFKFEATRSYITASATTERAGVGGRSTVIADEFSKHPKAYKILGQTMDTGPQLFCGTHYGTSGAFFDLTRRPDMAKEVMHWTHHPDRVKGLYRSAPELSQGYEILDKDFTYGNQCSVCCRLVELPAGELTDCCDNEDSPVKGVSRPYEFVTDGKPLGGYRPAYRSPYYDHECMKRKNDRDVAMHLDINPEGAQSEYFPAVMLRKYKAVYCSDPVWKGHLHFDVESGMPIKLVEDWAEGPVKLWVVPKSETELPIGDYGTGADISNGLGATPSVFSAGDARTCHKILEFATSNLYPEKFALYVHALCWLLKSADGTPALLNWESNGPGVVFGKEVMSYGYRRVYYRQTNQFLRAKTVSENAGWHHNPRSLRLLFDSYKAALTGFDLQNPSEQSMDECPRWRYSNSSRGELENSKAVETENPEEARMNHGDRPMADAIMWLSMQQLGAGRLKKGTDHAAEVPRHSLLWRRQQREKAAAYQERWA